MNKTMTVFLMAAGTAMAQNGHDIMQEVQKRQHSTSLRYEGTILTNSGTAHSKAEAEKHTVTKHWIFTRIGDFGNSKSIVRFTAPAEVKGVALLIVNHPNGASDQWFWRPNVGREQRISIQDRSQRFLETAFSYEDLEERDVDQYDYTVTGEFGGQWRIDAKPRKPSQYSHSYFFIDKTNYTYNRIEAYNKKGLIDREIEYQNYTLVQNIWTPSAVLVLECSQAASDTLCANGLAKSRTVLTYDKVEYNLPMKDEDFTVEALRRE